MRIAHERAAVLIRIYICRKMVDSPPAIELRISIYGSIDEYPYTVVLNTKSNLKLSKQGTANL